MMMCLIGVAVLIASTVLSGSFAARAGALKPKIDIANVNAKAVTFSHDFRVSLGRIASSRVRTALWMNVAGRGEGY